MKHTVDHAPHRKCVDDVGLEQFERRDVEQRVDVLEAARREVVDRDDLIASREQCLAQM